MIPLLCSITVRRPDGRRHRIWIPLPLLWVPIVALLAMAEVIVLLGCVVALCVWPRAAIRVALALPTTLYVLLQATGLQVEIARPDRFQVLVDVT